MLNISLKLSHRCVFGWKHSMYRVQCYLQEGTWEVSSVGKEGLQRWWIVGAETGSVCTEGKGRGRSWECRGQWGWKEEFRDAGRGGREPELPVSCSLRCTSLFPAPEMWHLCLFELLPLLLPTPAHLTCHSSKNFPQKPQSKLSSFINILFVHHTLHLFLNFRALSTVGNYTFFPC